MTGNNSSVNWEDGVGHFMDGAPSVLPSASDAKIILEKAGTSSTITVKATQTLDLSKITDPTELAKFKEVDGGAANVIELYLASSADSAKLTNLSINSANNHVTYFPGGYIDIPSQNEGLFALDATNNAWVEAGNNGGLPAPNTENLSAGGITSAIN